MHRFHVAPNLSVVIKDDFRQAGGSSFNKLCIDDLSSHKIPFFSKWCRKAGKLVFFRQSPSIISNWPLFINSPSHCPLCPHTVSKCPMDRDWQIGLPLVIECEIKVVVTGGHQGLDLVGWNCNGWKMTIYILKFYENNILNQANLTLSDVVVVINGTQMIWEINWKDMGILIEFE